MSTLLVRLLVFSAVCLLLPLQAADTPLSQSETLTIFVKGKSESSSFMRAELARLMMPTGLSVDWRDMSDRRAGLDFERLVSVELRGNCSAALVPQGTSWSSDVRGLAWTSVTDGRILPFSTVDCDNLRKVMSAKLANSRRSDWPELFGRAMARVIAHELFHMLAQTKHHHASGVSKACFTLADLTAERFDFDDVTLAMLRPAEVSAADPYNGFYEEAGR